MNIPEQINWLIKKINCLIQGQNNIVRPIAFTFDSTIETVVSKINTVITKVDVTENILFNMTDEKGDLYQYLFKPGVGLYGGTKTPITIEDLALITDPTVIPSLQQVTDVGNETSNNIIIETESSQSNYKIIQTNIARAVLSATTLLIESYTQAAHAIAFTYNKIRFLQGGNDISIVPTTSTGNRIQTLQDADGIIALTKDIINPTGLEAIDEGNGIGYRLIGRDPLNFAPIGEGGVDFSYYLGGEGIPIGTVGAKGFMSTTFGENNIAGGYAAFASGWSNEALGTGAVAMGAYGKALGHGDVTFGYANTTNTFANAFTIGTNNNNTGSNSFVSGIALTNNDVWGATVLGVSNEDFVGSGIARATTDQIFVIGNGTHTTPVGSPWLPVVKSNAVVITRAGLMTLPSATIAMIDAEATGKASVTKEWVNSVVTPAQNLQEVLDVGSTFTNKVISSSSGGKILLGTSESSDGTLLRQEWFRTSNTLIYGIAYTQIEYNRITMSYGASYELSLPAYQASGFFKSVFPKSSNKVLVTAVNGVDADETGNVSLAVQAADNTDTATSLNVGTIRYRSDANNSYTDIVMQTGVATYEWVNIMQNNW